MLKLCSNSNSQLDIPTHPVCILYLQSSYCTDKATLVSLHCGGSELLGCWRCWLHPQWSPCLPPPPTAKSRTATLECVDGSINGQQDLEKFVEHNTHNAECSLDHLGAAPVHKLGCFGVSAGQMQARCQLINRKLLLCPTVDNQLQRSYDTLGYSKNMSNASKHTKNLNSKSNSQ